MIDNHNDTSNSTVPNEYSALIKSFENHIRMKDLNSNSSNNNSTNNSNNNKNSSNITYTITLTGNGSVPPFNSKGLTLNSLGTLRIIIPAGLDIASRKPVVYTNYPENQNDKFKRDCFTKFQKEEVIYNGNNDLYFERRIERYGCFDYYVEWEENEIDPPLNKKKPTLGTFQIHPILSVNKKILPNDAISLQTYLTKCLGPLEKWDKYIQQSSELGYNMIHFTPIQEIGASGSSYSIYDQQSISSKIVQGSEQEKLNAIKEFISSIENKYSILSMIDLVWNHTAHNSKWLSDHPEAGYNIDNSPHLKSAVLLDQALVDYGKSLYGREVITEEQLKDLMDSIKEKVIQPLKLWEFYVLNVENEIERFKQTYHSPNREKESILASSTFSPSFLKNIIANPTAEKNDILNNILKKGITRDESYERFSLKVDFNVVFKLLDTCSTFINLSPQEQINWFEEVLKTINLNLYKEYDTDFEAISSNIFERIKYERVSAHGPKLGAFTAQKPMIHSYFTMIPVRESNGAIKEIALANNGWIYNYNPSVDFASKNSRSYLRRDVIIWGDCVKLRYGEKPKDSPWLWEHMKSYTQKMASIFQAIRIDNCHSTPIHVAQYLLDSAREIRPNLYVTCELFTGSEEVDEVFVRNLGINSLIREAMACYDSSELGRVCHRYGGLPICSLNNPIDDAHKNNDVHALLPVLAPALFMDCTHDNETPYQKRTVFDTLPNSAVVAMTISSIGSTKGYDEIYPKTIDLVNETKKYQPEINLNSGLFPIRKLLNKVHLELSVNNYNEIHVHQDGNHMLIQRYSPTLNESIFCLVHSAYTLTKSDPEKEPTKPTFQIPCEITEFLFGARISSYHSNTSASAEYLNGLSIDTEVLFGEKVLNKLCQIESNYSVDSQLVLKLNEFPQGSILLFRGKIPKASILAIERIDSLVKDQAKILETIKNCTFLDLNILLFRYHEEEKSITGSGSFHVDGLGQIPFCGLQGFITILNRIYQYNDLGNPLCNNLRSGNWIMDFIIGRLAQRPNLLASKEWLAVAFSHIKQLPRHFIPKYFNIIIYTFYKTVCKYSISLLPDFIKKGNQFTQDLALASIQFYGISTPLIRNPNVLEGVPDREASIAAGFPHFSTGFMRSWGRDTFISLRGILLVTNRIQEAKQLIIGFGSSLRFGLIPNLLDSGTKPRYNSRDSVWWYLKSIQDLYHQLGNEKLQQELLQTKIYRLFPNNPQQPFSTLSEIIQEILQSHAQGIKFREPNAGREIDDKMRDEGFNVNIYLNKENGFLYGGNQWNCGTWMDKMGESHKANNYGEPATPRDGAPIEITAMVFSIVSWLSDLSKQSKFPHNSVKLDDNSTWTYESWGKKIQDNFEKYYYVPQHGGDRNYLINPNYVRRRSIYKDVVGSTSIFADYQFRPNQCVAMSFAPALFDKEHAKKAIEIIKSSLAGPLGMKTLDPTDPTYHGNYDNSNDSNYKPTAKGWNYHNGPEWVWVYGFFLNSIINFSTLPPIQKNHLIEGLLQKHKSYIQQSAYASLPELTNRDGAYCKDSCESQAWSIATILSSISLLNQK